MATTKKTAVPESVRMSESQSLKALWQSAKSNLKNPLSQTDFGEKYEVGGQAYVQQMLNGLRPLNLETAIKFASYLNCSVEDFSPRLHAILIRYVSMVASDSDFNDLISKLTPAQADMWRKFDQLAEHDQKEISKTINDRFKSMQDILQRMGNKTAQQRLIKLTEPSTHIDS